MKGATDMISDGSAPTLRVAVIQAASVAFDVARTLDKLALFAARAAKAGARLAVFPEVFVAGYPRGLCFDSDLTARQRLGAAFDPAVLPRDDPFARYAQSAIAVPGPECDRMSEIAFRSGIYLVVGVTERDGGTLYCSSLTFGADGRLLARRRKLMPTGIERLVWGSGDGSTLQVQDTAIGRIGVALCWENYMPLLRTAYYAQGVTLYCAPTAAAGENWLATVRHIALEGRCFVLSSNQFALGSDYPDAEPAFGSDAVIAPGGSCIVDPMGRLLAGPDFSGEAVLIADLDLRLTQTGKFAFDAVGHYARPDIFQLNVDTRARTTVLDENGMPLMTGREAEVRPEPASERYE